jgi:hypothetical protein
MRTDNARPLAADARACRDCGVEVRHPKAVEVEYNAARAVLMAGEPMVRPDQSKFTFARCEKCTERRARAAALLYEYPSVRRTLGSLTYAVESVDAALVALDALRLKPKVVDRLLASERDIRLALTHLAGAGAAARWSAAFIPTTQADARADTHAVRRWAVLSGREAQDLVDAYGALLAARLDGPHDVRVPADADLRGCLLCGVGTVRVQSSAERDPWGERRRVKARLLGARRGGPEYVIGYVCRACRPATVTAGAVGRRAMELALYAHLKLRPRLDGTQLPDLKAFAALPLGTPPNTKPWSHVDDLTGLAASIRAA